MQFANPGILWALTLLAIPIAIHLFNLRRYKTIYFSDTRFLQDVQKSTKKLRNLKEWLLLVTRLFIITLAVLAFAKPFIPVSENQKSTARVILAIDNSASTTVGNAEMSPFVRAKQRALQVLEALPSGTQIALYATGTAGKTQFKTKENIRQEIERLQPTDGTFDWSGLLNNPANATIYTLTDAQKNNLSLQRMANDSAQWVLLPTINADEAQIKNVAIDSVWLEAPFLMAGQAASLFIRLKNYSAAPTERTLEISTNNLPEITLSAGIAAAGDTVITVALTQLKANFNTIEIAIANDNAAFDNRYHVSFYLPLANRVVALYDTEPSAQIAAVFDDEEFVFSQMAAQNINRTALLEADLIIVYQLNTVSSGLENTLVEAAAQANMLIIPSATAATAVNGLCSRIGVSTFGTLDTTTLASQVRNGNDPFFQNVFSGSLKDAYWPTAKQHFRVKGSSVLPTFPLLALANGDALFTRFSSKQQNYFVLNVPLDASFSDLTRHPIIVPILIKSLLKRSTLNGYNGFVGKDQRFDFLLAQPENDAPARVQLGNYTFIPRQERFDQRLSISTGAALVENGIYHVLRQTDTLGLLAFNAPKKESDLLRYSPADLEAAIQNIGAQNIAVLRAETKTVKSVVRQWQQGIQLWRYALILALLLILVEVILLRFLK